MGLGFFIIFFSDTRQLKKTKKYTIAVLGNYFAGAADTEPVRPSSSSLQHGLGLRRLDRHCLARCRLGCRRV